MQTLYGDLEVELGEEAVLVVVKVVQLTGFVIFVATVLIVDEFVEDYAQVMTAQDKMAAIEIFLSILL